MITTSTLDHFHRLQAVVLTLLDRARPYLDGRDSEAWATLAPLRADLTAGLLAMQVFKHREIFDPIIAAGEEDGAIVTELKVECIKLGLDYQAYTQKWATVDIDAHWPEYRLAALAMMRQIRARLAEQEKGIHLLHGPERHAAEARR